jgi:bla regulator protein BlaR1
LELGIPVVASPGSLEPGIFGIWRPVLLLPEGVLARLTAVQLEAVIAHELCHVRRRDNLAAAVHMMVEAMFWFHPLVWWIGTRLMEERERACDEEVLRLGNEPRVYAESILKVCEFYLESPVACVAGVTGANLKERIQSIMARRVTHKLDAARKLMLAAAGMAAICGPIFVGLANAPRGRAQSKAVEFEVASVRPGDPSGGDNSGFKMEKANGGGGSGFELEHRRLTIRNFNLYALVVHAYALKACRPFGMEGGCPVLSGGPDWLQKGGFDIVAKMPDDAPDYQTDIVHFLTGSAPQVHLAMQALLADRFHLKVHKETKPLPVFAFTVSKKGLKLKKADGGDAKIFFRPGTGSNGERIIHLIATNSTVQELADMYTKFMDRPVVDQTGLKDRFDFTVDYEVNAESAGPFKELSSPSLFKALEEQAGLKLEATKAPVEVLVIDHAEKPIAN